MAKSEAKKKIEELEKSKDIEFRIIMELAPESVSILCTNCVLIYRSQAEQDMYGCEEADVARKIPFQSPVNQKEVSYSDPGVIV